MSPGLLVIGLPTSQQEVVQAEMLPYMTATSPYYFPLVLVLCLRLSSKVSKSTLPRSVNIDITLGYPAANTV